MALNRYGFRDVPATARRLQASTAVLLSNTAAPRPKASTEARPLRGTANHHTAARRANRRTAPHRGSSTAAALRPRDNRMARRRRPNNRRRTTARPPTRHAPTARRLGPRGRRTEFAETIILTFAETYRDTL